MSLLLIDTGPHKHHGRPEGGGVKNNKETTEAIFDRINSCAMRGNRRPEMGNISKVGSHMTEIHKLLAGGLSAVRKT